MPTPNFAISAVTLAMLQAFSVSVRAGSGHRGRRPGPARSDRQRQGTGRARGHRRLRRHAADADAGLGQRADLAADAGPRHPLDHRRGPLRRQPERLLQRGRLLRAVLDPRLRPGQRIELPQGRHGHLGRHPDPAGKQGAHRSAQGTGRSGSGHRRAGRHHQLRHQTADRHATAHRHLRGTRARHAVQRHRPRRPLRRSGLRLPRQRRRRAPALLHQGRRRQPQIHLRRVRLADLAAGLAATGRRLRIQGADFGARLPADQRHHAAQGRSRHDAQQPAVEQAGDDHQQQSRPALRIPVERAVEDRLQRQPAPVPPRRLHRLPRRLRRHGPRLLRQRRLQRLRLHQPGRTQIAADRASHGAGPVRHRRADARLQRRLLVLQEQRKWGADFYTIAGLSSTVKLHLGARYTQVKRDELDALNQVDQGYWLPNAALVYNPVASVSLYGSYAQGLEHGGVAPIGTNNQQDALTPSKSKQIEVGVKAAITPELNVTAALFQIRKGLEYIDADNDYVRNGVAQHRGIELAVNGRATRLLEVGASASALNTQQSGTGDSDIDGKRVTNVPAFKSTVYADYSVPQVAGLKLNANWQYASKKAFDVQNTVFVPGYHVVNLGGAYATRVGNTAATFRAFVDNALNRYYWRDVTPQLGGYLLPGATRTFRVSAQFDL